MTEAPELVHKDLAGSTKHVCVIGSGPAGFAMSLELAKRGIRVSLVESGFDAQNRQAQKLSDAVLADSSTHAPMADAVHRRWGGTSHLWGGRCVPFNAIDFEPRPDLHSALWPIPFDSLAQHFERACDYADCGSAGFSLTGLASASSDMPISEKFVDNDVRSDSLERWSASPVITGRLESMVEQYPNVQRLVGRTCTRVVRSGDGRSVLAAFIVETIGGSTAEERIDADLFVLACGGVETTRFLLNAARLPDGPRIDGVAHLGRYYMGHLSGKIASLRLFGDAEKTVFDFERDGGHYVRRRLTINDAVLRESKLLNIAFWLDNSPPADASHGSGILSAAFLAMNVSFIGRRLAPNAIRKALISGAPLSSMWKHIWNVTCTLPGTAWFVLNFLYKRYLARPRLPGFFVYSAANTYALHFHAEQLPSADSRITLSEERDALGMPRAEISLRYSRRDAESVVAAHAVLDKHLQTNGIGELVYLQDEKKRVNAVLEQARDGYHQLGTVRMASSAESGVTDGFGRVFGVDNLFVCSSAVFPTSSQANPTLTLLAFAIRQAEHIAGVGTST